jgi:hypothetical protein
MIRRKRRCLVHQKKFIPRHKKELAKKLMAQNLGKALTTALSSGGKEQGESGGR